MRARKETAIVVVLLINLTVSAALSAGSADLDFRAAEAQQRVHEYEGAIQSYSKAIAADPQNAQYLDRRANCYCNVKNYGAAVGDCDRAIKLDPKNPTTWRTRGFALLQLGRLESGILDFTHLLELDPLDEDAHMNRILALHMLRDRNLKAYKALTKRLGALHPNATSPVQPNTSSDKQAKISAEALAAKSHSQPQSDKQQAGSLKSQQKKPAILTPGASQSASQTVWAEPSYPHKQDFDKNIKQASVLLKQHYPERALPLLETAIKWNDNSSEAFFLRGDTHKQLEQHKEAASDYAKSAALDPKNRNAWYGLGLTNIYLSDFKTALDALHKAEALDPKDHAVHMRLGTCYYAMGDYEHAIEEFNTHLRLDPHDDKTMYRRAECYSQLKKYEQALSCYIDLEKRFPQDEDAHRYCGDCYYRLKQYDKAVAEYTQTITMDPDDAGSVYKARASAYLKLGQAQLANQDMAKAKAFFEKH